MLKHKHFVYDLVKVADLEKQPNIDVILRQYVEGLGNIGQRVSVRPEYAYNELLLPGLAVYASPENAERFEDKDAALKTENHSSPTAPLVIYYSFFATLYNYLISDC